MNLCQDRTQEIKRELSELNQTLKMSVQKAIRIGELLIEQKELVGHGKFLSWLDSNFDMGQRNAYRYMELFEHQSKIANLANLQEAYKQIETIEAQAKLSKEERERHLIAEYRKTGKKPDGWDRGMDYRIKKDEGSFARQNERIENERAEREQRAKEYKEKQEEATLASYKIDTAFDNALKIAADTFLAKSKERNSWKEKIRLSDGGKEDAFLDAIIEYMETLENDNRRIEACNNIIKICRNISVELQRT